MDSTQWLMAQIKSCTDKIEEDVKYFPHFRDLIEKLPEVAVSIGRYGSITTSGDLGKLKTLMTAIRSSGWEQADGYTPPPEKFSSWIGNYDKHPRGPDGEQLVGETIHLSLYFYSTVCKRVQVGTKMEEVPVYEIQCGEAE